MLNGYADVSKANHRRVDKANGSREGASDGVPTIFVIPGLRPRGRIPE
jgi:hypothetical protein